MVPLGQSGTKRGQKGWVSPWGESSLSLGGKHPHFVGLQSWVVFGRGDFFVVFWGVCFLIFPFSPGLVGSTGTRGLRAGRVQPFNGIPPEFRAPLTPSREGAITHPPLGGWLSPSGGLTQPVPFIGSAPSLPSAAPRGCWSCRGARAWLRGG